MKGIVFNLLEEVVRAEYGEDAWDDLLDRAGLDGVYTSLGGYPDADMGSLVGAASDLLGLPPGTIVRWFGRRAIPLLSERYPDFFEGHTSARSFLLTLNSIIHPEVRKVYPGADVPVFDLLASDDPWTLSIGYRSARKMCALAEGFIEGSADHFGEHVEIEQPSCMLHGDDHCLLKLKLTPSAA